MIKTSTAHNLAVDLRALWPYQKISFDFYHPAAWHIMEHAEKTVHLQNSPEINALISRKAVNGTWENDGLFHYLLMAKERFQSLKKWTAYLEGVKGGSFAKSNDLDASWL